MPVSHLLLALLVAVVWGVNFIFVKLGLNEMPPLLLCAVRFLLASVPAIFFIKLPTSAFRIVISYGLIMFALQFALLFVGLYVGMATGMAALIVQVQVFFSMFFAAIFLNEKPDSWQILGALIAFAGIGLVAMHFDKNISLWGFLAIIAAAATWGFGNLLTKRASHINMMSLVVWGSFAACFPMVIFSLVLEGPTKIVASYHHLSWQGVISVLYIVYVSTWVGYGVWNWLLSRYSVGTIVPFTLLVPIIGMLSSVIILREPFFMWQLAAGVLVMMGLFINLMGARFFNKAAVISVAGNNKVL